MWKKVRSVDSVPSRTHTSSPINARVVNGDKSVFISIPSVVAILTKFLHTNSFGFVKTIFAYLIITKLSVSE